MKYVLRLSLICVFICSSVSMRAQHREIGAMTNSAMGIMYGPMFDIRPILKWGQDFKSVRRLRIDRTYMNFNNYQGVGYMNLSTGIYLGHEWRKSINDKFSFVHGPEIGTFYSLGIDYLSISPSTRYLFGALYRINEQFIISIETPLNFAINFSKFQGVWNGNSMSVGMFTESNLLTLSYIIKPKK